MTAGACEEKVLLSIDTSRYDEYHMNFLRLLLVTCCLKNLDWMAFILSFVCPGKTVSLMLKLEIDEYNKYSIPGLAAVYN